MARAIAVVEDDESIREMLRYYFQSVGYAVRAYESGEALFAGEEGQSLPALNYPFDFAFFARETPRPFPGRSAVEILTALGAFSDCASDPHVLHEFSHDKKNIRT